MDKIRNILKLVLACFTCLLLYINSQSLFAQKILQLYDGDVKRNLKNSVEVAFYEIKNRDLILVLDSIIGEWEKSHCYEPVYLGVYTYSLTKKSNDLVTNVQSMSRNEFYWEITIKSFRSKNFASSGNWGCFRYKNRLFVLGGYPCEEFFSPLKKKLLFNYYPSKDREDVEAFVNTLMSWTYNYRDNHFVFRYKRGCNFAY